jgi:hypothetical protein
LALLACSKAVWAALLHGRGEFSLDLFGSILKLLELALFRIEGGLELDQVALGLLEFSL